MKTKRTFIIVTVLVVVLGLLTVSIVFAGQGSVASLVSATGGSGNPTGASGSIPQRGGTLLLDQAPNQSNGLFSDADCGSFCAATGQQSIAENFVLNDTYAIEELVVWGGYFNTNSMPTDNFTVIFHANNGGAVGAPISTESNVPSSRMQTGVVLFGVNEWVTVITPTTPVELTAGTYWVEIFNNTTTSTDAYFWEVGNLDATNGILNDAFSQAAPGTTWNPGNPVSDNAIQIYGSLVTPQAPSIAISKTPANQTVVSGGNANFTITVTNTGDVDLAAVDVSDPLVPDCDSAIGALAISATVSYGCQDVGVVADYTNVATVTSQLATGGPGPTASASANVTVTAPTSVSLTGFGEDASAFSPVWLVAILAVILGAGFVVRRKLTA